MKKLYKGPEIEVSNFSLVEDILSGSLPENGVPDYDGGIGDGIIAPGFGWNQ